MRIRPTVCILLLAGAVVIGSAAPANAQFIVAPAPVVSYYYVPSVPVYPAPIAEPMVVPQTAYYYAAPPVAYYSAPAVAYYPPGVVAYPPYPVTVTRGLFGRTTVRSPYYRVRYW